MCSTLSSDLSDRHPKFETPINATLSHTNDFPTVDPSGNYVRPDFLGLVSTDDGDYLQIHATGIQQATTEQAEIISGESDDASIPYGAIYSGA